ncbi:MAG: DNA polymerase III subunit delta [Deltaproteobacteria bacterium]|nr:DNA polymerase III subunit delta [Deltaproteobacteria bacterium]
MTAAPGPTDVSALCAAARKQPRPVYLILGEALSTGAAAHALIDALVPAASRDFNLEIYDGRTTPMVTALAGLRMRGLLPGTKVVWVRETTVLLSTEKKADLTTAVLESLDNERRDEAAARLLTLLALSGWTQEQLNSERADALSASALKECFGTALEPAQVQALGALQVYCQERGLAISAYHDDSELLLQLLESGVPPGSVLLLTAAAADARKRVFKQLHALGAVVDLRVARERSGAVSRDQVLEICRGIAAEFGLRLEPTALERIGARAGNEVAGLTMEMEKLCLYVGAAKTITAADVEAGFRDLAESWIFDFTSALAAGQGANAVRLLRDLLGQGDHPLRLLAMIAREIRLLLAARDCLDGPLAGKWRGSVSYPVFQSRLHPLLGEMGEAAFGKMHPFRVFKYLSDAARVPARRLERALIELSNIDLKFKRSRGDPVLLLETFILDFCRPAAKTAVAALGADAPH